MAVSGGGGSGAVADRVRCSGGVVTAHQRRSAAARAIPARRPSPSRARPSPGPPSRPSSTSSTPPTRRPGRSASSSNVANAAGSWTISNPWVVAPIAATGLAATVTRSNPLAVDDSVLAVLTIERQGAGGVAVHGRHGRLRRRRPITSTRRTSRSARRSAHATWNVSTTTVGLVVAYARYINTDPAKGSVASAATALTLVAVHQGLRYPAVGRRRDGRHLHDLRRCVGRGGPLRVAVGDGRRQFRLHGRRRRAGLERPRTAEHDPARAQDRAVPRSSAVSVGVTLDRRDRASAACRRTVLHDRWVTSPYTVAIAIFCGGSEAASTLPQKVAGTAEVAIDWTCHAVDPLQPRLRAVRIRRRDVPPGRVRPLAQPPARRLRRARAGHRRQGHPQHRDVHQGLPGVRQRELERQLPQQLYHQSLSILMGYLTPGTTRPDGTPDRLRTDAPERVRTGPSR